MSGAYGMAGFSSLKISTIPLNQHTGLPDDGVDQDMSDPTGKPNFQSYPLQYYGSWLTTSQTTAALLKTHDGQCGASGAVLHRHS